MLRTNGAAMNKYIEQQFAALRYEKNILVVEETTSAGGCGSFNAASSTRLLHVLRQPVFMTVRRGAFLLPERSMRT